MPQAHLSAYNLKPSGRTIVWLTDEGDFIDTVEQPGQPGIPVIMEEILGSFTTADGRQVPDLMTPAQGLSIDDGVRCGFPVLTGTRIPYDTVAGLAQDGLSEAEIVDLYPNATTEGIHGAVELAELVARDEQLTA